MKTRTAVLNGKPDGGSPLYNRRGFLEGIVAAGVAPFVLPSFARGFAANEKINVSVIGYGRIAHTMDVPCTLKHTALCRITAVCDLDRRRREYGAHLKNIHAADKTGHAVQGPRGVLDIRGVFQALADVGYSGVYHIEYERDFENSAMGLAESFGYYRGVLSCIRP